MLAVQRERNPPIPQFGLVLDSEDEVLRQRVLHHLVRPNAQLLESDLAFCQAENVIRAAPALMVIPQDRIKRHDTEVNAVDLVYPSPGLLLAPDRVTPNDEGVLEVDSISR
jgi:hypothetical protein